MRVLRWLEAKMLFSKLAEYVLPTVSTLWFNHRLLGEDVRTVKLPKSAWAFRESHALLDRSEQRLASIEAKGPGLAAACAVVAAGVLLALSAGWGSTTLVGKAMLVAATAYAVFSLAMPIFLVGPQPRHTLDVNHLGVAAHSSEPEDFLARHARELAQRNALRNRKLANLQNASRNDLVAALVLLVIWATLDPVAGVLHR